MLNYKFIYEYLLRICNKIENLSLSYKVSHTILWTNTKKNAILWTNTQKMQHNNFILITQKKSLIFFQKSIIAFIAKNVLIQNSKTSRTHNNFIKKPQKIKQKNQTKNTKNNNIKRIFNPKNKRDNKNL